MKTTFGALLWVFSCLYLTVSLAAPAPAYHDLDSNSTEVNNPLGLHPHGALHRSTPTKRADLAKRAEPTFEEFHAEWQKGQKVPKNSLKYFDLDKKKDIVYRAEGFEGCVGIAIISQDGLLFGHFEKKKINTDAVTKAIKEHGKQLNNGVTVLVAQEQDLNDIKELKNAIQAEFKELKLETQMHETLDYTVVKVGDDVKEKMKDGSVPLLDGELLVWQPKDKSPRLWFGYEEQGGSSSTSGSSGGDSTPKPTGVCRPRPAGGTRRR